RAARITGVDRSVGLNEVFVLFDSEVSPTGGADNAHGDGLAHAEGIADSQRIVADLDFRGVANGDARQVGRIDLQDREIGLWIRADDLRLELPLVSQCDLDLAG